MADITPPNGISMPSQGSPDILAKGAYMPLTARVMTIDDGENQVAFISGELLYWGDENIERMREMLHEQYGLTADKLVFNTTHTHNVPAPDPELEIYEDIIKKTVELIARTFSEAKDAELYFGKGKASISVNRRGKNRDGYAKWSINPYGPIDEDVLVVKAVDETGKTMAILFNHACHPTTIRCPYYGGDFIGYAMAQIEQEYDGAIALFMQGAAGEIKGWNENQDKPYSFTFEGGLDRVKQFGRELALSVQEVLENPMAKIQGSIDTKIDTVQLPVLNEMFDEKGNAPFKGPMRRMARLAKLTLESMDENGNYRQTKPCEVQVVSIGPEFLFIGMNGEICVDIGLRIKAQLIERPVMVCGYTNLNAGYIPSMSLIPEKGYEASRVPYSLEMEDFLVGKAMELVEQ